MPIKQRSFAPTIADTPTSWDYTIKGSNFTAGLSVKNNFVIAAEPIIHSMVGKRLDRVRDECAKLCFDLENNNPKKTGPKPGFPR